ncbi:MAG: Ig-like domain-containing protein [Anaerolineaceae bacterium]
MFRSRSIVHSFRFYKHLFLILFLISLIIQPARVSAEPGYSLLFDGNNDYVLIEETDTVMGGTSWKDTMSFSLWVKPIGTGFCTFNDAAQCDSIFGDRPRWWGMSHGTVGGLERLWVWNFDGNYDKIGIPYTAGEWVHIAWVHSGGMLSAYKNGVLVGSVASGTTGQPSTGALPKMQIGAVITQPDRNWSFHGEIDELRIYSTALSQSNIQSTLFTELSGSETGLRAYYKMSNGSGTVLTDDSVNSFNGTLLDGAGIVPPDGNYPLWVSSTAFDKPLASDLSQTTNEDSPAGVTLMGLGPSGSALTYTYSDPPHGSLSGTAPNLTYTPDPNYFGVDSFTYQVWNGATASAMATVSLTIFSLNDAPVANSQSLQLNEDSILNGTLTANEVDGDPLNYVITAQPTHGAVTGTLPNFTYTPNPNYFGPDNFSFKANDTHVDSNIATINLTINSVNDVPVADNKIINTPVNTPVGVTLTGTDVENSPLTFAVVSGPSHGSLSGSSPNLTYTPNNGYAGSDSFTYTANDSQATSPVATVSINITSGNQPPVANNQSLTTNEDVDKALDLTGSDPEAQQLTYTVLTQPAHGSLIGTAPSLTYHPNANYFGADSFTFKVNDGQVDSNIATISITVTAVNDAPVANNLTIGTAVNQSVGIVLTGTDVENDPLTFSVVVTPIHGNLTGTAPNLIYTPANNFSGSDSFTYLANDGTDDSTAATVNITVSSGNLPPVAYPQEVSLAEDTAIPVLLSASDPEGAPLIYSFLHPPTYGTLMGTAPMLTYVPATNYYGTDYFIFRVGDGVQWSQEATVDIVVNAVNDAPRAIPQAVGTTKNVYLDIQLTGSDVDGDILSFSVANAPLNGTLGPINPLTNIVRYTSNSNYVGQDFFRFTASDGSLSSGPASITITISDAGNLPPVAQNDTYIAFQNTPLIVNLPGVLANDTDPNGDTISAVLVSPISNGNLILNSNGSFTFTPLNNSLDDVTFTYRASDGLSTSSIATVTIHVSIPNRTFLPLIKK